jgi:uncharacterized YccA/Bax inhibitor family protein
MAHAQAHEWVGRFWKSQLFGLTCIKINAFLTKTNLIEIMAMFNRSSNPTLGENTFTQYGTVEGEASMTIQGTVNKVGILTVLLFCAALLPWNLYFTGSAPGLLMPLVIGGAIGGLVVAIVLAFKKEWATFLAPAYALLEGLFVGGLSAIYEASFNGIVLQAVLLTIGTLAGLLAAYRSGLIKATENFKLGVFAATAGIGLVYLASFVMRMFGMNIPYIHDNGLIGIGFSLFVVVIAALNLVLDFDFIEQGAEQKAPKFMEWYAAFGLMVTLVWLYIEFLRLLSKLASRD